MKMLSGKELLNTSQNQISVPAFDVGGGNIDMINAVCEVLASRNVAAFLVSTPSSIEDYFGMPHFVRAVETAAERYNANVVTHLDHATKVADVEKAIDLGFSSVMYDGSSLSIEENSELTKKIVQYAHSKGVSVEAELGVIAGKEDLVVAESSRFPTLEQAVEFIEYTGIDYFAPAIGTVHGFFKGEPDIQWDLVHKLNSNCLIPLVLHGGTGLPDPVVSDLLQKGFQKINYATGIRAAFMEGLQEGLSGADKQTKPQIYLRHARKHVKVFVHHIVDLVLH
jgi:tagatose 1,6-diphosphate aldolase GatY/KbaY